MKSGEDRVESWSAYVAVGVGEVERGEPVTETSGAGLVEPRRRAEGTGRESAVGAGGRWSSWHDVRGEAGAVGARAELTARSDSAPSPVSAGLK